ncbi:Transposon Ty3-G Gag-Pol polyprotein [Cucumis melo var. makuwa]|uniref:Transposon Ty3-G Gag-Pol polyprotein n=1 Tax=Cucumis melo var. makuwa TaxID=1194695 RepID=A0A5D3BEY1_CUCMM|nr:Transposon Ty3-G Gag-Pol polyprotein [Cucumis melo var. makuwa]
MDFVEGLPKSGGFEVILVVVDRLSKYGHFLPLKHPFTAKLVAELFVKEVVRLHGFPLSIVLDRDKIFLSHFWTELFRLSGTKLNRSTAYHLQFDGQTEVVNGGVETYLRCFCNEKPKEWVRWLPWAEYWYNTIFQRAIGMTPFQVVYDRQPPAIMSYGSTLSKNSTVEEMLQQRDAILITLREHLRLAQEQMKVYADCKRRNVEYCVEKVGFVAYRLELPDSTKIHPVFHVSQLRKLVGQHENLQPTIQFVNENYEWKSNPEEAVEYQKTVAGQWEVLVSWEGLPKHEATWESYDEMQLSYPTFHLEDKVVSAGYGFDYFAAVDMLRTIRSANGFTVTIVLKPFSFEGKRRQDEVKHLVGRLKEHTSFLIDIDTDRLLEKDLVTLDDAVRSANNAVLLAINSMSIVKSEMIIKFVDEPQNDLKELGAMDVMETDYEDYWLKKHRTPIRDMIAAEATESSHEGARLQKSFENRMLLQNRLRRTLYTLPKELLREGERLPTEGQTYCSKVLESRMQWKLSSYHLLFRNGYLTPSMAILNPAIHKLLV